MDKYGIMKSNNSDENQMISPTTLKVLLFKFQKQTNLNRQNKRQQMINGIKSSDDKFKSAICNLNLLNAGEQMIAFD